MKLDLDELEKLAEDADLSFIARYPRRRNQNEIQSAYDDL